MKIANIDVFDGLVPAALRHKIEGFIVGSTFRIGWADAIYGAKSAYKCMFSGYTKEELINSGLGDVILSSPEIAPFIEGKEITKCVVNLTRAGDVHFTHSHPIGETVVLYYANLDWLPEWWGETMFYNDDGSSIVHACRYTPGRIVVFDGTIPHAIRPQSAIGPQYRFTVTTIFTEVKPKVEA
jgi:SM-20-related protein